MHPSSISLAGGRRTALTLFRPFFALLTQRCRADTCILNEKGRSVLVYERVEHERAAFSDLSALPSHLEAYPR